MSQKRKRHSDEFKARVALAGADAKRLLIEAKDLFGPGLLESQISGMGFTAKPEESALSTVKGFPDNVTARAAIRLRRKEASPQPGHLFHAPPEKMRLADRGQMGLLVDFHPFRLPKNDFRPRGADERIGVFPMVFKDYTGIETRRSAMRHVATRWDVRKSDPQAAVSPAAEPVTFYVDKAVPAEWRPLVYEGALWWNAAFEAVGIKEAIRVLDQPEDPAWDPADMKHSMIYWNLSDKLGFSGLAGPALVDPRTGQVLKGAVFLNAEFPAYASRRYQIYSWWRQPDPDGPFALAPEESAPTRRPFHPFLCDRAPSFSSQLSFARLAMLARGAAPNGPEVREMARQAFRELVAHEVGHALGLPHNWKASLASRCGDVLAGRCSGVCDGKIMSSSVMDYNPVYLAPKGVPQKHYILAEVGPYDHLTIEYLYKPLDGLSPEEEAKALDAIAARAETQPGLVYDDGSLSGIDPTTGSDDLGDDPLAFAESRLTMLHEEVLPRLPELVLAEGYDYSAIPEALDVAVFSIALDYIDNAARHVGGRVILHRVAGSPAALPGGAPPLSPISPETQRRALAILDRHIFRQGAFALAPETAARLKPKTLEDWDTPWRVAADYDFGARVAGLYQAALATLLAPARLARILENERLAAPGAVPFTIPELFASLETSAFGGTKQEMIPADRRALQRLLVRHLVKLALDPAKGTPAEASQIAAETLRRIGLRLAPFLAAPAKGALDGYAQAHWADLDARIRRALDAVITIPPGK